MKLHLMSLVFSTYAISAAANNDTVYLKCTQIQGHPENAAHACAQMESALHTAFPQKTVHIISDEQNMVTKNADTLHFVFSEKPSGVLKGRLETTQTQPSDPPEQWQITTRILDTTDVRVGYKSLARALLKVNKLDQF